jgi:predicted phosphodiesterase
MRVAVFADVHAHAEALDAVLAAASGFDQLWSLGDMIGGGPDAADVVRRVRERCTVALMGNHDYGATGGVELDRFKGGRASIEHARAVLSDEELAWMRTRRPAARRSGVQCWHGGPRNPVWEFVTAANARACLDAQKDWLGLVGHTHTAAAFRAGVRRPVPFAVGEPLSLAEGKWLLNPGAVGAPVPPRGDWWDGLDADARAGAFWLELDLENRNATWHRAPYDPAPCRARAIAAGLT